MAKDLRIGLGDFCSISPRRPTTSVFGGCLILDNTHSIASIIPDDADDAKHSDDAKQGAEKLQTTKGKCRETGVTGSERNGSQRNCTKMKRALERNQDAGKCKGRT